MRLIRIATLPSELVDGIQHAVFPSVMSAILDKIIGPDVIGPLRPQTDAGPVIQPEPLALRLFTRNLQPLPPPDPRDTLEVDHPACRAQQRRNPAIAVTATLLSN